MKSPTIFLPNCDPTPTFRMNYNGLLISIVKYVPVILRNDFAIFLSKKGVITHNFFINLSRNGIVFQDAKEIPAGIEEMKRNERLPPTLRSNFSVVFHH